MKAVRFFLAAASCALFAAFINRPLGAGQEAPAATTDGGKIQETNPPPAAAPKPGLLMTALGQAGIAKPLEKARVNIYGYAKGGFFHNFSAPGSLGPTYFGYNNFNNKIILDKISLNVERPVDPTKKAFDVGFHVEGIYGADAALIHSNGMMDTQTGRNQWDLLQGYVDVALPGLPVRLRAGKWIELAGFEQFSANIYGAFGDPARAFYSYGYQFLYAEPGTQTGALATFVLNPRWTFDAGFTRGWNQSTRDANDSPDFLGRVTFAPSDKTSVVFVMTEGPEFPAGVGRNLPPGDNRDWWTALDLVITHKPSDQLSLGLGADCVTAPHIPGLPGGVQEWGGLAGYVSYAVDQHFTLNTRLEWYKDAANGFSTGAPSSANYFEITLGMPVKPFPKNDIFSHLLLRPEVRYDHSDRPVFAGSRQNQITFSLDALFTF
jgi:hypothetical protein